MSTTCGRDVCGLNPGDKFCMTCGRAAADVAAEADTSVAAAVAVEEFAPPPVERNGTGAGMTARDAVYLGNRQAYRRWWEEEMNPVRALWVLFQLAVQNLLLVIAPAIVAAVLGFVASILWLMDQVASNPLTSALSGLARLLSVLAVLTFLVCCVVALFRKVPIRNADWVAYVDDEGPAAPAVLAHISGALQRRGTPAETMRVKRVALKGGGHRDVLEIGDGDFTGYVTAYAFGRDLHVGWVYMWRLSTVRYVVLSFVNMVNVLRARQTEAHVIARYEPAKSLREAIHAATREGADMAGAPRAAEAAMPAGVPVDAVGVAPDGNGLFAA